MNSILIYKSLVAKMVLSERKKVKILRFSEAGLSNVDIAKRLKCNESSARRLLKKYHEAKEISRKKGSGRKRKTSEREDRLLQRLSIRNRFANSSQLRREFIEETGTGVSSRTIRRRLCKLGLKARRLARKPLLTRDMQRKRLGWAKQYENFTVDDWKAVIFSDESKYNLLGPDGRQVVRRRTGERYSAECITHSVKFSPTLWYGDASQPMVSDG